MVVLDDDICADVEEFIVKLSDAFYTSDALHLHHVAPGLDAAGSHCGSLTGFYHAGYLGENAKIADEFADISRLSFLDILVTEDDINRSGHGSRRDLAGIFLYSKFLEI